ncbi:SRPBCC family protein [Arthrobacter sp. NPDC055138]
MDENAQRVDRGSLQIDAPPATVYRALTDPNSLERWLPPEGMVARVEHFTPGVGGGFRMVLTYLDASGHGKTSETTDVTNVEFVDLVPYEKIVQQVRFTSDDAGFAGTMTMTWELQAQPSGTLVSVAATNVPPGISVADHEAGLASSLANLAAHVEQGTGTQ